MHRNSPLENDVNFVIVLRTIIKEMFESRERCKVRRGCIDNPNELFFISVSKAAQDTTCSSFASSAFPNELTKTVHAVTNRTMDSSWGVVGWRRGAAVRE